MKKDGPAFFEVLKSALYTNGETKAESKAEVTQQPPQLAPTIEQRTFVPREPQRKAFQFSISTLLFAVLFYLLSVFVAFYLGVRFTSDSTEAVKKSQVPITPTNNNTNSNTLPSTTEKPKWSIKLVTFDASTTEARKQAQVNARIAKDRLIELGYTKVKVDEKGNAVTVYYGEFDARDSKEAKDTLEKLRRLQYKTKEGKMTELYKGADFVKIPNVGS